MVVSAAVTFCGWTNHRQAYSADTLFASDYSHSWGRTESATINIEQHTLTITKPSGQFSSVFLELSIERTWLSYIKLPVVSIGRKGDIVRQTFSPFASGTRYLDFTRLVNSTDGDIVLSLQCDACIFQSSEVFIHYGPPKKAFVGNRLIVSAHPDDSELGAFSLFDKSAWVVTITNGESGRPYYPQLFSDNGELFRAKASLRVLDSRTVPAIAGVAYERTANLGYFDTTLDDMWFRRNVPVYGPNTNATSVTTYRSSSLVELTTAQPRLASWDNLVEDLEVLLRVAEPDWIVSPHPVLDRHTDHYLASLALYQAAKASGSRADFVFYVIHGQDKMYPYGDAQNLMSLPHSKLEMPMFDYLVSRSMDREMLVNKFLAMEAMHDLRPQYVSPNTNGPWAYISSFFLSRYLPDKSFFRKALRPNELFFIVKNENLDRYFKQFIMSINEKGPYLLEPQPTQRQ